MKIIKLPLEERNIELDLEDPKIKEWLPTVVSNLEYCKIEKVTLNKMIYRSIFEN